MVTITYKLIITSHAKPLAWFLSIASVRERLCPAPRLLIISGVIYTSYDWLNMFYGFYMAAVVSIVSGCDVSIHTRREKLAK